MIKRFVAVMLMLVMMISLASCGNDSDFYIDDDGVRYMVCRDGNGEIQVNASGKLLVYDLNENDKRIKSDSGEYLTRYVDFNGQIVTDKFVEIAEMSFTLPNNFTDDRDNPGYFRNEAYNGEIFVYYYDESIPPKISYRRNVIQHGQLQVCADISETTYCELLSEFSSSKNVKTNLGSKI